jgi:hypothetical protein
VEKTTKQGALCSVLLTRYLSGDQVKKTEMRRTCGTYGGDKTCIQSFSGEKLREGGHLKDKDVDGRIILKWIF